MVGFAGSADSLLLWKYFEIMLTSLFNLARRGRGIFSIVTEIDLAIFLLLLLGFEIILGVNLDEIFALRVVAWLSV